MRRSTQPPHAIGGVIALPTNSGISAPWRDAIGGIIAPSQHYSPVDFNCALKRHPQPRHPDAESRDGQKLQPQGARENVTGRPPHWQALAAAVHLQAQ